MQERNIILLVENEKPSASLVPKGDLKKEYSRDYSFLALKERQATAQGKTLVLNVILDFIAPRFKIEQSDAVTWGKIYDA